jgi:hypothetical protein
MKSKLRIIVLGIMGRTPVAGVAWQALHYIEGIRRLGHDVYYVEDTQTWPYNPETETSDSAYTIKYIDRLMNWCGLNERWAYRDVSQDGHVQGLSELQFANLFKEADAIINVTGSSELRETYLKVPIRIYLETDPGVPQIEVAQGERYTIDFLGAHTHHFTFAENYGQPRSLLPIGTFTYHRTRQPVVLEWWQEETSYMPKRATALAGAGHFTTIATWKQLNDIVWNDDTYTWSKDRQFLQYIDLPARSKQGFELALARSDPQSVALLESHDWKVSDALSLTKDIFPYRDFVIGSRGEFTVAKDQYVRLRTGWFSDRSACYLAAGRPVVTQDTGFGTFLPTGEGLFAFNTMEDVLAAVEAINSHYERHARAARAIAEQYFAAEAVIGKLFEDLGVLACTAGSILLSTPMTLVKVLE